MKGNPMRKLHAAADTLKDAGEHPDVTPLLNAAHDAASAVRDIALQSREPVRIRVVAAPRGVRVTVVGARAGKYRALMERALEQRYPATEAAVRADIQAQIRRAK
jgi:hypothetical protein